MPFKTKQPEHWHQVLGVRNDATREQVKAAYRRLYAVWHPDRHIEDKNLATAKFAEINNAYKILMREHHFEVANVPVRDPSPSRPPLTRTTTDSKFSTRSSPSRRTFRRKSSTTLGSSASSSRQSSFESVNSTPLTPVTPRLSLRRTSTSYDILPRPAQSPFHHAPPKSISNVLASHSRSSSSDFKASTYVDRQSDCGSSTPESPEKRLAPPESATDSESPRPHDDSPRHSFPFFHLPPFVSLGGHSRVWKYALTLTLEELFFGKLCPILITRHLLNGKRISAILDVDVPPGCQPGTEILFKGVGHEHRPGKLQDVVFVIQQAKHDRFSRADNDLILEVHVPWTEILHRQDGRLCIAGIDGKLMWVRVTRPKAKVSAGCEIIREAGMPIFFGDKVIGRGNLVVHWEIITPKASRWGPFRTMLRFTWRK